MVNELRQFIRPTTLIGLFFYVPQYKWGVFAQHGD